jgi:hypothetical protein
MTDTDESWLCSLSHINSIDPLLNKILFEMDQLVFKFHRSLDIILFTTNLC